MEISDQVKKEFQFYGYNDARLGRKLSDADYFILSEAKRYVQNHYDEMYNLINNNIKRLKTEKKILNNSSKKNGFRNNNNQKQVDELKESINTLNNKIKVVKKEINSLNKLMTSETCTEIENTFGTLLYHYETGYLTYNHEIKNDQLLFPEEINYSAITKEIINQYYENLEQGNNILD